MPLADYTPEKVSVAFPGGSFEVRGLGVADLNILFKTFVDDMEAISALLTGQVIGRPMTEQIGVSIAMDLIRRAPSFVSAVIALAADEPDMIDAAGRLPLHAQVATLAAVGRLTFEDVAGLGNILATLLRTAGALTPPVEASSEDP